MFLTDVLIELWMGAAIDGITRTDMGIWLPVIVSISTVTAPSSWYDAVLTPKDANAIPCVVVGWRQSLAAISAEIKERWAPSSKSMFARSRMCPAMTGATAVFSKQVVLLWGLLLSDVEVRRLAVVVTGTVGTSIGAPL